MENRLSSTSEDWLGNPDAIHNEFLRTRDPDRVLKWRSSLVDRTVITAWRENIASAPGVAALAVGGYGRHQLFPFSDVDLLLLFADEKAAQNSRSLIAPFLQSLWDSGLRVSQSVRTIDECIALHDRNIELNISLLDLRYLSGDVVLAGSLCERLPRFVHGRKQHLIRHLARLTAERHAKFGGTIYHLEPNVKETPGSLRDYQVLCWVTQLLGADGHRLPSTPDFEKFDEARRFLAGLRCFLHYKNGRDANVLTFDAQEEVTETAGMRDPAVWMREYFRHARRIYRAAANLLDAAESQPGSSLFASIVERRSRFSNFEFSVLRDRVYFRAPQLLEHDPAMALRLFAFVARHGFRLSQDSRERLARIAPVLESFYRRPGPVYPQLADIFVQKHVATALREMHETGFLLQVLPELEQIDCLVVRDFYHRYTVDEHSLVAIEALVGLANSTDPKAQAFREILSEFDRMDLLVFALLLHDAGKGTGEGGHVEASLWLAECAMERVEMPAEDRDLVRFLIHRHLDLSATMSSRDLSEHRNIHLLADSMGTVERLRALALITYADISAVNPNAMTPWRATELFRLFRLTYRELTRELETERIEAVSVSPGMQAFLSGFPRRYLLTHSTREQEEHFELSRLLAERGVASALRKHHGAYQLTVLSHDRPALFADLAGTISAFGLNILKAEAFSNRRGEILDAFLFADPNRTLELNPSESGRLLAQIERAVLGKLVVRELLRNRPPRVLPSRRARVKPRVAFDDNASPSATLVEVMTNDRPGLLYELATVFSTAGCNIEVVLIDTEAHKAIDVFYVTKDGSKLSEVQCGELQTLLDEVCRKV